MLEHILIKPLEYVARITYLSIYDLTLNYGLSLLVLSVVSYIFMSSIMRLVTRFSERETIIQNIINPQVKKIKMESNGVEQHQRIARLYKRYSYHPILSLRSVVPFLIQLPFLFAAYIMLNNLDVIRGVSFFVINDISKPDSLLFGINLLPFLMTIIYIITVLLTKKSNLRDKMQAMFVAVLFLAILYKASAALIIFWTMNNVLSLIRTIIVKGYN